MDATAWVAIAGIAGTVLAPLVLERMRRESARREHLLERRTDLYADLLQVAATLVDNAATWSATPLATLPEAPDDELNRIMAQVRALGSPAVYEHVQEFAATTHEFNRRLFISRLEHERAARQEVYEDERTMTKRMSSGEVADVMRRQYHELLAIVRRELSP